MPTLIPFCTFNVCTALQLTFTLSFLCLLPIFSLLSTFVRLLVLYPTIPMSWSHYSTIPLYLCPTVKSTLPENRGYKALQIIGYDMNQILPPSSLINLASSIFDDIIPRNIMLKYNMFFKRCKICLQLKLYKHGFMVHRFESKAKIANS